MVGVQSSRGLRQLGTLFARGAIGHKTDAELLDLFAEPDDREAAFEALVLRHGPSVLRACRRVLIDPNDAEDAFQATFLILARRASSGSIGRPDSLGPWLYGIALRVARKARVAAARRRRHEQQVACRLDGDCGDRHEIQSVLREEIDGLPEPLRAPVVLCYLEEMTYQAAARLLRVSEGTIRGRLAKARGLLRIRLSRKIGVEPVRRRDASESQLSVSSVPAALIAATIRAARTLTSCGVGSLGISAAVAELMEGVLTMMLVIRWMVGAVMVAAIGLATAGGIALASKDPDDTIGAAEVLKAEPPGDKLDPTAPSVKAHPANVMTLEAAIDFLMKKNLPIEAARREIPIAVAQRLTANLRANFMLYNTGTQLVPLRLYSSRKRPDEPPQFDLNISYPLDASFLRQARDADRAGKTVAEAQLQDSIRNQIDHLYSVYVDVQAAQEKTRREHESLVFCWRLVRKTANLGEKGTDLGEKGTAERNAYRSSLIAYQRARRLLLDAEEELGRTERALLLMLDVPVAKAFHLEVEGLHSASSIPPADELIRLAEETRPDLAALRLGLDRTLSDLIAARQQLFVEKVRRRAQGQPTDDISQRANVVRAELKTRQIQKQIGTMAKQIKSQIEQCHRECRSTLVEPTSLEKEMQAATQYRDAVLRRYEAGEIGVDEVLDAMHKYDAVDRRCVEALVKHRRSTLALNTAVGMRILP